jgi:hypothetical protein
VITISWGALCWGMGSVIGARSVRSLHPSPLSKRRPGGVHSSGELGSQNVPGADCFRCLVTVFFLWFGIRISCVIALGRNFREEPSERGLDPLVQGHYQAVWAHSASVRRTSCHFSGRTGGGKDSAGVSDN